MNGRESHLRCRYLNRLEWKDLKMEIGDLKLDLQRNVSIGFRVSLNPLARNHFNRLRMLLHYRNQSAATAVTLQICEHARIVT